MADTGHDALLTIYADLVDDLERVRIATENRLRALRDVKGMEGQPEYERVEQVVSLLSQGESMAILDLKRAMRAHPLGPWVKRTIGVGEKQAARLLGCLGDPAWNAMEDRPRRGPAELWAYCGFRPGQKRQKGVRSNWNAQAKMRAFLIAESCIKHRSSPYRAAYDNARVKWADREVADAHKHAHALRVVAKEVLKDLWRESRRLRLGNDTHSLIDPSPAEDLAA